VGPTKTERVLSGSSEKKNSGEEQSDVHSVAREGGRHENLSPEREKKEDARPPKNKEQSGSLNTRYKWGEKVPNAWTTSAEKPRKHSYEGKRKKGHKRLKRGKTGTTLMS